MTNEQGSDVLLESVRRQRAGLHAAIIELEEANSAPAAGRADAWAKVVADSLRGLARAWSVHTEVTEGPGSLFDEVVQTAPRLANAVKRLRTDHVEIAALLAQSIADFAKVPAPATEAWVTGHREDVTHLLGMLTRHRQRGSDLMYEAYDVDIGGED